MFDRFTARTHGIRIFVEPFLRSFDNLLVLTPRNATLPSLRALSLDRTCVARMGPITRSVAKSEGCFGKQDFVYLAMKTFIVMSA